MSFVDQNQLIGILTVTGSCSLNALMDHISLMSTHFPQITKDDIDSGRLLSVLKDLENSGCVNLCEINRNVFIVFNDRRKAQRDRRFVIKPGD